jgi:hypothetical protein
MKLRKTSAERLDMVDAVVDGGGEPSGAWPAS